MSYCLSIHAMLQWNSGSRFVLLVNLFAEHLFISTEFQKFFFLKLGNFELLRRVLLALSFHFLRNLFKIILTGALLKETILISHI